jgi:hypothetical protein
LLIESVQIRAWRDEVKSGHFRPGEYARQMNVLKKQIKFIENGIEIIDELKKEANLTYQEWLEFKDGYKKYE